MKIAHISDLHLLALAGAVPWRLFNKRLTGYLNIRFKRGSIHRPEALRAVATALRERGDIDHLVITGDLVNLALEQELGAVRDLVEGELGLPPERISVVPGNHDYYTRGSYRERRFERFFAPYLASDLPDAGGLVAGGAFPYVKLRGPVALVGLSSAVPRAPIVAAGRLGVAQLAALRAILAHREVRARTVIVLQHHPWHNPASTRKRLMQGLDDAAEEHAVLDVLERGMLLHGHLHRRLWRTIPTTRGQLDALGATSASLIAADEACMAGYNLYQLDDSGRLLQVEAWRLDGDGPLRRTPISRQTVEAAGPDALRQNR